MLAQLTPKMANFWSLTQLQTLLTWLQTNYCITRKTSIEYSKNCYCVYSNFEGYKFDELYNAKVAFIFLAFPPDNSLLYVFLQASMSFKNYS